MKVIPKYQFGNNTKAGIPVVYPEPGQIYEYLDNEIEQIR